MPKPADYPDWANTPDDPGDLVKPPASRLARGWKPAEVPPAQYWNWWKNLVGRWFRWLEEEDASIRGNIDSIQKGNLSQVGDQGALVDGLGMWQQVSPKNVFFPVPHSLAFSESGWERSISPNLRLVLTATASNAEVFIPLRALVPSGFLLTDLRIVYKASSTDPNDLSQPLIQLIKYPNTNYHHQGIASGEVITPEDSILFGVETGTLNATRDLRWRTNKPRLSQNDEWVIRIRSRQAGEVIYGGTMLGEYSGMHLP